MNETEIIEILNKVGKNDNAIGIIRNDYPDFWKIICDGMTEAQNRAYDKAEQVAFGYCGHGGCIGVLADDIGKLKNE